MTNKVFVLNADQYCGSGCSWVFAKKPTAEIVGSLVRSFYEYDFDPKLFEQLVEEGHSSTGDYGICLSLEEQEVL